MSERLRRFHEDRELRNAARAVVKADVGHLRESLTSKTLFSRVGDRIGEGARDVFDTAKGAADDHPGVAGVIFGALILWFARSPLLGLFGLQNEDLQSAETGSDEPVEESDADENDESFDDRGARQE